MSILNTVLELVGKTPLVRLNRVGREVEAEILAKIEYLNPSHSVKDRIMKRMFEDAERRGLIKLGSTIVDASTGSHGIAISMICAVKGYRALIVMPSKINEDVKRIMRAFGAQLVFVEGGEEVMARCIATAKELAKEHAGAWMPDQFYNENNVAAHEDTGLEIFEATNGALDAFVAGVGTGGTLTGVARFLKARNRDIKIVAVEPSESPVLSGGQAGPHGIYGIGDGIVPPLLKRELIDRVVTVSTGEAVAMAKRLAREEGILCGPSSGANVAASIKIASELGLRKRIVTMIPDTGLKYLTTGLMAE